MLYQRSEAGRFDTPSGCWDGAHCKKGIPALVLRDERVPSGLLLPVPITCQEAQIVSTYDDSVAIQIGL